MNPTKDNKKMAIGHLAASITIVIWGTTFIATKVLLRTFTPYEILFLRFLIGYLTLWIVYPKPLTHLSHKRELLCAASGLCGITLYYLFENIALTYTQASNVGVIVSVAPFFTGILCYVFHKEERLTKPFFIGFLFAMIGISFISFPVGSHATFHPFGDFLGLIAAILWAVYSIIYRKLSETPHNTIQITRRMFFYGILFMIPVICIKGFDVTRAELLQPMNLWNLLFLGFGASALCFVTWNFSVRHLGTMKTSVYIYLVPVITTITSAWILKEFITGSMVVGILLTLIGLALSQWKTSKE